MEKQFSELYSSSVNRVMAYVGAHVREKDLQEDIVQEVFATAWRKREDFLGSNNPVGWLINAAKYKILEAGRKAGGFTEGVSFEDLEIFLPVMERGYEDVEWMEIMRKYLKPEEYRIFCQFYIRGQGVREMAVLGEVNEKNMRVKLYRLRKKLAEMEIFCK